jgi:hypothetical protein
MEGRGGDTLWKMVPSESAWFNETRDLRHPDYSHGSIRAADDAPDQVVPGAMIAAEDLQGLRLQLIALLCKPLHYVSTNIKTLAKAGPRHLQHRKEYKNVPTDKDG